MNLTTEEAEAALRTIEAYRRRRLDRFFLSLLLSVVLTAAACLSCGFLLGDVGPGWHVLHGLAGGVLGYALLPWWE